MTGVIDLNGDGLLDLIGIAGGNPVRLISNSAAGYHWHVVRLRAQPTAGDQRINSFGIGGDIEVRSGLLTQKQAIAGSPVHFGLGTRTSVDVTRIVWPNGVMQADFDRRADEAIVAEQRLKGSCPWIFADDGTGMRFVTDFLWRSPLGLRINAQDTAGVTQTEDWVKIRGDQLAAQGRLVRRAHHRGAVGNPFHRSRVADGRRSSRGHRGIRGRAVCQERAGAGGARDREAASGGAGVGRIGPRRDRYRQCGWTAGISRRGQRRRAHRDRRHARDRGGPP